MADRLVIDCETGESVHVPLTPEEEAALDQAQAQAATLSVADMRIELENVQVANITETDWIIAPPSDTPADILSQINNNLAGWQTFRRDVRALPIKTVDDPTTIVWPSHPIRPATALTPPPAFLA